MLFSLSLVMNQQMLSGWHWDGCPWIPMTERTHCFVDSTKLPFPSIQHFWTKRKPTVSWQYRCMYSLLIYLDLLVRCWEKVRNHILPNCDWKKWFTMDPQSVKNHRQQQIQVYHSTQPIHVGVLVCLVHWHWSWINATSSIQNCSL